MSSQEKPSPVKADDESNMLVYSDEKGLVVKFRKPPIPDILDIIEKEELTDEDILLQDEDEADEDESDAENKGNDSESVQQKSPKEMTPDEMIEASNRKYNKFLKKEKKARIKRLTKKMHLLAEKRKKEIHERWDFPKDKDEWDEEDLGEEWADPYMGDRNIGYDPEMPNIDFDDETDWKAHLEERKKRLRKQDAEIEKAVAKIRARKKKLAKNPSLADKEEKTEKEKNETPRLTKEGYPEPPVRPYYVPYRKPYPVVPENHPEIETPQDVVEELDKIEEFLRWGSFIFPDGSSYEGTFWDDLAHGKGVYVTPLQFCRYEGEWFQNMMDGHGVLDLDIPTRTQPIPDSEEEKQARARGDFIKADYMPDEDREWLKMDIEDTIAQGVFDKNPLEDDPIWKEHFGEMPEKGRYRYAGQWKHNRMHGCGVYEVNLRQIYGKFYFGELLEDPEECSLENCAMHSGLAEVAAGKAKMFVKKPDGMVRELEGPYSDPVHPYMYEEEELWMAPGFIHAFYQVPDEWKRWVEEVDMERESWLNSFYKSPFRLPMQSELEQLMEQGSEFLLLRHEPDPADAADAGPHNSGEVLYHVPTGKLINWVEIDGEIKFYWQRYNNYGLLEPEAEDFLPDDWEQFKDPQKWEAKRKEEEEAEARKANEDKVTLWEALKRRLKEAKVAMDEEKEKIKKEEEEEEKRMEEELKMELEEIDLETQLELERIDARLEYQKMLKQNKLDNVQQEEEEEEEEEEEKEEEEGKEKVDNKKEEGGGDDDGGDGDGDGGGDDDDGGGGGGDDGGGGGGDDGGGGEEDGGGGGGGGGGGDGDGDDDDDDEEDEKKPRSFGKVAEVEIKNGGRNFPTVFASMTMSMTLWLRAPIVSKRVGYDDDDDLKKQKKKKMMMKKKKKKMLEEEDEKVRVMRCKVSRVPHSEMMIKLRAEGAGRRRGREVLMVKMMRKREFSTKITCDWNILSPLLSMAIPVPVES